MLYLWIELEVLYNQCKLIKTVSDLAAISKTKMVPIAYRMSRLLYIALKLMLKMSWFSKFKLVKNYLKTTLNAVCSSNLLLLYSEKDIVDNIIKQWLI